MLELEEGVFLSNGADMDLSAQVVDVEQVLLPQAVDIADEQAANNLFEDFVWAHFHLRLAREKALGLSDLFRFMSNFVFKCS